MQISTFRLLIMTQIAITLKKSIIYIINIQNLNIFQYINKNLLLITNFFNFSIAKDILILNFIIKIKIEIFIIPKKW